MQTISGVLDDGREVIGVVKPGKYPGGGSVLVEERHLVDKPQGLDWDKAAMLPFLVRKPALLHTHACQSVKYMQSSLRANTERCQDEVCLPASRCYLCLPPAARIA